MSCAHAKNASAVYDTEIDRCALKVLSDGVLNQAVNHSALSKKRKPTSADDEHVLGESLTILSHASSPYDQQLRLIPKILVPRSCLPLAFIDLDASQDGFVSSRLFRAYIEALEDTQDRYNGRLVIASKDDGPILYAIERVKQGAYTLCKLGGWVTLEHFERVSLASKRPCILRIRQEDNVNDVWWKAAVVDTDSNVELGQQNRLETKVCSRGIRLSMKPPLHIRPFIPTGKQVSVESPRLSYEPPISQPQLSDSQIPPNFDPHLHIEELLKNIRIQYQELLYISKTSLAYFAKGPLSRARAATAKGHSSSLGVNILIDRLRSNVLSRTMADTKYSETLPTFLQELPVGITSDDEEANVKNVLGDSLRRSKKRKNVAKSGLFPGEEKYIIRWYISQEKTPMGGPDTAREERIKLSLTSQKARETQLQLILILEILALEASIADNLQPLHNSEPFGENEENRARPKGKKSLDLSALLDILVERLCIWQSTSQDELNSPTTNTHATVVHTRNEVPRISNNDQLKDFCHEVLIPFYAARLPEHCSSICQKLGGLNGSSPVRPPLSKSHSFQQVPQRPNMIVQSHSRQKSRRTLERVLTDDKIASRQLPLSLTRSATDPIITNIKRESRDVVLPALSSQSRTKIPRHYSQREVDLTAVSQATEARLQRKAAVEQELKGAIATLKKPNPRLAVKELVESAEQRVAGATSKSRKSKNPIRNPFGQGVQVKATPKGNRKKDVLGSLSKLPPPYIREEQRPEVTPASNDLRIPSSSIKPKSSIEEEWSSSVSRSTFKALDKSQLIVEQTPSRKWSRLERTTLIDQIDYSQEEDELNEESPELPVHSKGQRPSKRSSVLSRTPSNTLNPQQRVIQETVTGKRPSPDNDDIIGQGVQGTPMKTRLGSEGGEASWSKPEEAATVLNQAKMPESIYESLGWDDDDIDELT